MTRIDLESIMLSEVSQTEKGQKPYDFTHMWNIKQKVTHKLTKQTKRNSQIETTEWWSPKRKGVSEGDGWVKGQINDKETRFWG